MVEWNCSLLFVHFCTIRSYITKCLLYESKFGGPTGLTDAGNYVSESRKLVEEQQRIKKTWAQFLNIFDIALDMANDVSKDRWEATRRRKERERLERQERKEEERRERQERYSHWWRLVCVSRPRALTNLHLENLHSFFIKSLRGGSNKVSKNAQLDFKYFYFLLFINGKFEDKALTVGLNFN